MEIFVKYSAEVFYEIKIIKTFLNVMSLILKVKLYCLKKKKLKNILIIFGCLEKKPQHIYSLVIPNKVRYDNIGASGHGKVI